MIRDWEMGKISNGRTYHDNDMVRIGCADCEGCSYCCENVEDTIVLDPYDIYNIYLGSGLTFQELMAEGYVELGTVDAMVLPHMAVKKERSGCGFLDSEGRCLIHDYRPGFCRLFPLGRVYDEDGDYSYFIEEGQCIKPGKRSKVKVRDWLMISDPVRYHSFIVSWHALQKHVRESADELDAASLKNISLNILNIFYLQPYSEGKFYEEFSGRMKKLTG